MRANFGEHFKLTIFGESHGPAIGVVVDGLPAGARLDEDYIARLYRFGERHPFVDGLTGERFRGTIRDVLYGGELRVEKETGEICDYLFKEIEYVHDRDGEVSAK